MRLNKTLAASAVAVMMGTSAMAGGMAVEVVEPPVVIVEPEETRSTWGIVVPVVAIAALIALAQSN